MSIRVRLTVLFSLVVFGSAAVFLAAVYAGLRSNLDKRPVSARVQAEQVIQADDGTRIPAGPVMVATVDAFEQLVNKQTLATLRQYSLLGLATVSGTSLAAGWVIAGAVLRPIERIRRVAAESSASDLSGRIGLRGPDDELTRLAATLDDLLDRLERSWQDQRRFVADASHELRNPLAIVDANLDLAQHDPDAEERARAIAAARRASARMSGVVEDLLAGARGRNPLEGERPVDLGRLARDGAEEFRAAADQAGVRLVSAARAGLWVHGDPDALARALANLLDNAVRHTPVGGSVTVTVTERGNEIVLAVADSGPGVPAVDRERVFERAARSGAADADDGGLGLAIVRQIAEAHRGAVRLLPGDGPGATFEFSLPRA